MGDPKTILIVDDTPADIHVIKSILQGDYKIKAATSGEKVLQIVAKAPPDLMLLDVMMSETDGYEESETNATEPFSGVLHIAVPGFQTRRHGFALQEGSPCCPGRSRTARPATDHRWRCASTW